MEIESNNYMTDNALEKIDLGTNGPATAAIALGTWVLGGGVVWGAQPDDSESIKTIHTAIEQGINLIDTAPAYGFGHCEEVVGKALQGKRDKVVLATKCGLWWEDQRGSDLVFFDGKQLRISLRPDTIRSEIEQSLRRLKTDYIDLYQTHRQSIPPEKTPIAETFGCLEKLKQEGKIRAIGVSNVSLDELKEYVSLGEIAGCQNRYSMLCRGIEKDILPYCHENNIAVLAYSPLEQGLLTGKITMDSHYDDNDWRSNQDYNPWFKMNNRPAVLDMLSGWEDLREKYNCTQAQLTIAWTLKQPGVTHVLCGARKKSQVLDNAGAGKINLSQEDSQRITDDLDKLGDPT